MAAHVCVPVPVYMQRTSAKISGASECARMCTYVCVCECLCVCVWKLSLFEYVEVRGISACVGSACW